MGEPPVYPVTPITVFAIRWWGTICIVYGILTCIGGDDRWRSPAYATLNLVPGSPWTWGTIIFGAGVLILGGSFFTNRAARNVGLWLMAAWAAIVGSGFVIAAIQDNRVSLGISVLFVGAAGQAIALTKTDERRHQPA